MSLSGNRLEQSLKTASENVPERSKMRSAVRPDNDAASAEAAPDALVMPLPARMWNWLTHMLLKMKKNATLARMPCITDT